MTDSDDVEASQKIDMQQIDKRIAELEKLCEMWSLLGPIKFTCDQERLRMILSGGQHERSKK